MKQHDIPTEQMNGIVEQLLSVPANGQRTEGRGPRPQVGWSNRKVSMQREEKEAMAEYFVHHDFLITENATGARLKFATILVNPGTTQKFVLEKALEWIKIHDVKFGPFDITWYTPGTLMPTTLKDFRDNNPDLLQATQLFLFPGRLDIQIDSVASPETAEFVDRYDRTFTYAFLSANSFDIKKGRAYFHFSSEIALQKAIALKEAKHKFLFLDSTKLDTISEGGIAYSLEDLLKTSHSVTIYTACSTEGKNAWIKSSFDQLCERFLTKDSPLDGYEPDVKAFRLRIVGLGLTAPESINRMGKLLNGRTG